MHLSNRLASHPFGCDNCTKSSVHPLLCCAEMPSAEIWWGTLFIGWLLLSWSPEVLSSPEPWMHRAHSQTASRQKNGNMGGHKRCRQWSHFSRASNQLTRLGDWRLAQRSHTHSPLTGFNPLRHALDPFTAWNPDASFFLHQKSLNLHQTSCEYLQEHNIVILSIFHSFDLHAGARDYFFLFLVILKSM